MKLSRVFLYRSESVLNWKILVATIVIALLAAFAFSCGSDDNGSSDDNSSEEPAATEAIDDGEDLQPGTEPTSASSTSGCSPLCEKYVSGVSFGRAAGLCTFPLLVEEAAASSTFSDDGEVVWQNNLDTMTESEYLDWSQAIISRVIDKKSEEWFICALQ